MNEAILVTQEDIIAKVKISLPHPDLASISAPPVNTAQV